MSVQEMHENDEINKSHAVKLVEGLQSLRKNDLLYDIKFETDDGTIIVGHKCVLMSVSPYFHSMFSNGFGESEQEVVKMKELDSTVLEMLVDYIYTGEILVTVDNVQAILPVANVLQLAHVSTACEDLMKIQLDPYNCIRIKAFAEWHSCMELFSISEAFIKKHFLEVTECDEFLSLSFEEIIKLISFDDLSVPDEDKVFECVISWVKHELDSRKEFLPQLMEHVRLSLVPATYILKRYYEEPLLNNSSECKDYMIEALHFHTLIKESPLTIPQTIRNKFRQFGDLKKVILMFIQYATLPNSCTEWYDPTTNLRKQGPEMKDGRGDAGLVVIQDQFVYALGGLNRASSRSGYKIDLAYHIPCWLPMVDMLVSRMQLGVCVFNDCIYAVGGIDFSRNILNSVEVFDINLQQWKMISSMSTERFGSGVGVLNNRLYVVGGHDGLTCLKSVECYDPSADTWTSVEEMSVSRQWVGVGVLNGLLYAVGGYSDVKRLRSAEVYCPITRVWSPIADMHLARFKPGVVVLDGLLYVFGGQGECICLDSMEMYNPNTNTWVIKSFSRKGVSIHGGVVVNKPPYFITN